MKVALILSEIHAKYVNSIFQKHKNDNYEIISVSFTSNYKYDGFNNAGIRVIDIDDIASIRYDTILLGLKRDDTNPVLLELHKWRLKNIFIIRPSAIALHMDFLSDGLMESTNLYSIPESEDLSIHGGIKPCIGLLDIHVCDECNLNCRGCTHFSPFIKRKSPKDLIEFNRELVELKRLFCNIFQVSLLGGEPLLYPDICIDMVEMIHVFSACRYFSTYQWSAYS